MTKKATKPLKLSLPNLDTNSQPLLENIRQDNNKNHAYLWVVQRFIGRLWAIQKVQSNVV
jgi:hypothetical protein